MNPHSRLYASLLLLLAAVVTLCYAATSTQSSSSYTATPNLPRRERNLDHWDAETLAYYLGVDANTGEPLEERQYPGHDAVVMFYAQWCSNCHALAPSFDAIATHLKAGSKKSKLIMSVFDCEGSVKNSQLCNLASVSHYPTLMFIGAGVYHDNTNFFSRLLSRKKNKHASLRHTTKFPSTVFYPDAILDWVRTMQGLSRWHRMMSSNGVLRLLRNGLLGFLRSSPYYNAHHKHSSGSSLPVGVPTGLSAGAGAASSSSDPALKSQLSSLQSDLERTTKEAELLEKATVFQGTLMESLLLPRSVSNQTDVFGDVTKNTKDWQTTDPVLLVERTCIVDLSLDYCSRLINRLTNDYVEHELDLDNLAELNMTKVEVELNEKLQSSEPYCTIFEACLESDFADEECRPPSCPFQSEISCNYVNACLEEQVQRTYAAELGLIADVLTDPWPPIDKTTKIGETLTDADKKHKKKKKGAWGF